MSDMRFLKKRTRSWRKRWSIQDAVPVSIAATAASRPDISRALETLESSQNARSTGEEIR